MSDDAALAAHAGSQFDARVARTFSRVMAGDGGAPRARVRADLLPGDHLSGHPSHTSS